MTSNSKTEHSNKRKSNPENANYAMHSVHVLAFCMKRIVLKTPILRMPVHKGHSIHVPEIYLNVWYQKTQILRMLIHERSIQSMFLKST